ncbi:MAG: 3-deoxy-manno-octulosonate cytidylyltransferase [Nitrospirae bacterium]|nr:3-deoxy-manno-octulosonate cytidylyltransferase [Magnetococcales bacterium]HAT50943.1 3-deoxy-manno-octulosonate cytidylyltransferase [Alphaproteobacteria bacterium]
MPVICAIIPARMASSRFPGKPLEKILGLSMIEHVRRRVGRCRMMDRVIVATCDQVIYDEVTRHGGQAVMTADTHVRCTERVEEAAQSMAVDIVVNVQGDMPLVRPEMLETLVAPLLADPELPCTDLMSPIRLESEFLSRNVVKVVCNRKGHALYYSRQPIPDPGIGKAGFGAPFKQLGVIAFRKKFLEHFVRLPATPLEISESVDMMRPVEHGFPVLMVSTDYPVTGVDTPQDLIQAETLMREDQLFPEYRTLHG